MKQPLITIMLMVSVLCSSGLAEALGLGNVSVMFERG
ncbi:hypothetical protein ABIE26_000802 [Pedobacter africanus]|uniref:Uncharacterized protein n=1 Tax=Pedobacter africanus TaxID=151894 RepID=A0ACC6KU23_9SPHI|nr:hypothetical protein [Pedobacter africanus]